MKITILVHYLKSGGAEKRASVFANYFANKGFDVSIITMYPVDKEYFVNENIKRYYIAKNEKEYLSNSYFKRLKKLKELLLRIKPDKLFSVLITHGFYAGLATRFNKELRRIDTYYLVSLYQRKYTLIKRMVDFASCLWAKHIVLQCNEQIKCNRLFKKKCMVCYNPISSRWKMDVERNYDRLNIVGVGRLTKQKNFIMTMKGVVKAHSINPNISLDIYGIGPLQKRMEAFIVKNKAEEYIRIHPFSFNLLDEYKKYNVYISSSKYEGFPNSLAEAMYSGLICLSTKCPSGPKEMIDDVENGFFINNPSDISRILLDLINNSELCKKISKKSAESIEKRFDEKVVLDNLVNKII